MFQKGVYDAHNVMLSGTHTHSGPAGFSYFPLYNIMSLGKKTNRKKEMN